MLLKKYDSPCTSSFFEQQVSETIVRKNSHVEYFSSVCTPERHSATLCHRLPADSKPPPLPGCNRTTYRATKARGRATRQWWHRACLFVCEAELSVSADRRTRKVKPKTVNVQNIYYLCHSSMNSLNNRPALVARLPPVFYIVPHAGRKSGIMMPFP